MKPSIAKRAHLIVNLALVGAVCLLLLVLVRGHLVPEGDEAATGRKQNVRAASDADMPPVQQMDGGGDEAGVHLTPTELGRLRESGQPVV